MQNSKLLYTPEKFSSDNLYILNIEHVEIKTDSGEHKALKFLVRKGRSKELAYYYYYIPKDIPQIEAEELLKNLDSILAGKMCLNPVINSRNTSENEYVLTDAGTVDEEAEVEEFIKMMSNFLPFYERVPKEEVGRLSAEFTERTKVIGKGKV